MPTPSNGGGETVSPERDRFADLAEELCKDLGGENRLYLGAVKQVRKDHPEAQGESFLYRLFESGYAQAMLRDRALGILELAGEAGISRRSLAEQLPRLLFNTTILEELLLKLEGQGEVRCGEVMVARCYPTFLSCVRAQPDSDGKVMLLKRLGGATLEAIGQEAGITRERVRQRIKRQFDVLRAQKKRFYEDRYAYIFENYTFTCEEFQMAFQEPVETFAYLELSRSKRRAEQLPLERVLTDERVSAGMRRQAERVIYRQYVFLNGRYVKRDRSSLTRYVASTRCLEQTHFEDLLEYYRELLQELGLDQDASLALDARSNENKLSNASYALWSHGKRFRYYDIALREFDELLDALELDRYEDMELSTLKLFRENPELMEEYDIRDEYELHNLLRKLNSPRLTKLRFGKMPTIEIGHGDHSEQMLTLLLMYAPVSADVLAARYEEVYGVKAATVLANYLREFDEYYFDGVYSIDAKNLTQEQAQRLSELLTQDYYPISEIQEIYLRQFPDADPGQINPYTLKTLGFKVYAGYVVKNTHSSAVEYFNGLLTCQDVVDAREFESRMRYVQAYSGEVTRLRHVREIIEFAPRQFVNLRRLRACGVDRKDLEDYCTAVWRFVGDGTYFTVTSLRQDGFNHPLDELGFEEWFYSSVLLEDRERFSYQHIGGTRLFRCGKGGAQFTDLLRWMLQAQRKIDIFDLRDLLEERYGIAISKDKLVEILRSTDMYYDDIMEAAYMDYDTYFEEV